MFNGTPTDIANQALDAIGSEIQLGDIEEGTREAQVLLRAYGEARKQLLRGAPWDFARRESPLTLLADATGQTLTVGTQVPSGYVYSYAYPIDCARVRYIPWTPNISPAPPAGNIVPKNNAAPAMPNIGQSPFCSHRPRPARFLITNDANNPAGQNNANPQDPRNWSQHGISPQGRLTICCNVQQALCVYTLDVLYPSVWDALFRGAFVAYLASEVAMALLKDKKFALQMRTSNIAVAKEKIAQARIADGNEMFASSDLPVDWMQTRRTGGGGFNGFGSGALGDWGCWGGGWGGSMCFADGTSY